MLNNPKLALCSNRSILPKSNEKSGSPEEWFSNDLLATRGLLGVNLDFFVDWSSVPNTLTPILWIKQVLSADKGYNDFLANIKATMIERFGEVFLQSLFKFSANFSFQLRLVILDDQQDWNNEKSQVCIVTMASDFTFSAEMIAIDSFKEIIRAYSGGPVHVGNKGLIYGATKLECMLSRTDSAYPGDMDMLLLNGNAEPVAIFEFKKHTLSPDVTHQTLSNYYPKPDARKYDRLAIFREYILNKSGHDIPITIFFYPSNSLGEYCRVEVLTGEPGKLKVKANKRFKLPIDKSQNEMGRIVSLIPKIVNLYHS